MAHIFRGSLFHKRFTPKQHAFTYPIYVMGIDCDHLELLSKKTTLLSYNRFNLFSFHDADYLKQQPGSIGEKARALLQESGHTHPISSIKLISSARFLGICFNPVSFYYCYNKENLVYIIAEVNNTFGERHPYILNCLTATQKKEFYVSPFFSIEGNYKFKLSPYGKCLRLGIDYFKEKQLQLTATLTATAVPLGSWQLIKTCIAMPLTGLSTFLRILFEAFRLKFILKLPLIKKGHPMNSSTFKYSSPNFFQELGKRLFVEQMHLLSNGCLIIQFPSGVVKQFGDPTNKLSTRLWIKDHRFFSRVLWGHEIGLGEAFTNGEWEADDVHMFLHILSTHIKKLTQKKSMFSFFVSLVHKTQHFFRRNTIANSKKNIQEHYDLNNDFFKLFLDDSMMYSCALYTKDNQSLPDAQQEKMKAVIKKANIKPEHHVLEVGSGWGSMAIKMVQTTGCKVTTITISQEQFDYAKEKIIAAGLEDKITLLLQDYRHIKGSFDRIISIEMIEAVGHDYMPSFFQTLNSLLAKKGKMVIQGITMNDKTYDQYRKRSDWIRKHIFPGGHLPSLQYIKTCIEPLSLSLDQADNIGLHYVTTLNHWKAMFLENLPAIKDLGFDDQFIRKWLYYFYYCQAGFSSSYIQNYQLVFSKSN